MPNVGLTRLTCTKHDPNDPGDPTRFQPCNGCSVSSKLDYDFVLDLSKAVAFSHSFRDICSYKLNEMLKDTCV